MLREFKNKLFIFHRWFDRNLSNIFIIFKRIIFIYNSNPQFLNSTVFKFCSRSYQIKKFCSMKLFFSSLNFCLLKILFLSKTLAIKIFLLELLCSRYVTIPYRLWLWNLFYLYTLKFILLFLFNKNYERIHTKYSVIYNIICNIFSLHFSYPPHVLVSHSMFKMHHFWVVVVLGEVFKKCFIC